MRSAILLGITALICVAAVFKPKIGLLGYVWFSLMRPDILSWSTSRYPLSEFLALATVVGSFHQLGSFSRVLRNPFTVLLILLAFLATLSSVFAVAPDLAYPFLWQYLRGALMAIYLVVFIDTLRDLQLFILVMAFSLGIFGMKFGAFGVLHGGVRFTMGIGGLMGENNTFALGLVMALPLIWYGRMVVENKLARLFMLIMGALTIATIIQTFSRGAALALMAIFLIIPWRSRFRVGAFLGLVLMAGPTLFLLKDSYSLRLQTILNPEAEGSANSRIVQIGEGLGIWGTKPLLGVGFGGRNYMLLSKAAYNKDQALMIHNTYLAMLTDSGVFAFLVYCFLLFGAIFWLGRSARQMKALGNGLHVYPWALQTALIAFAIDSSFHPRVIFDFAYMLLMMTAAWYHLHKQITVAAPSPAAALPAWPMLARRLVPSPAGAGAMPK